MKLAYLFVFAILFASVVFPIQMTEPQNRNLKHGDTVNIGEIGPGQTIAVAVKPEVILGGKFGQGGVYDQLVITNAPEGWKFKNSKLTSSPLQAEITAPQGAEEGEYEVVLRILDEENREELGLLDFTAKIRVKKDIMAIAVEPNEREVSAGQPAKFSITITNKGNANDVFEVGSEGFRNWKFKKELYLPAKTSKTINYEVVGNEEGNYNIDVIATSKSSYLVTSKQTVNVLVKSNLISDFGATNNGVLFFPVFEGPLYAIAGIISNFFS